MPKTTKRGATKRAEKIAKAHATPLPSLEVKGRKQIPRGPGYKPPARGVARYPWAIGLTIVIIGLIIFTLYTKSHAAEPFTLLEGCQSTNGQIAYSQPGRIQKNYSYVSARFYYEH